MPTYRIHKLKENARQGFRWAAHTPGTALVKPRDYEQRGEIEATSPYAAWTILQNAEQPLELGDLLEDPAGSLRIFKYVGFEEARWVLPEVKPAPVNAPEAAAAPQPVVVPAA